MANNFFVKTEAGVGSTLQQVASYTPGAGVETTIIGLTIANVETSQILVDVKLVTSSVDDDDVYLVKAAPVPVGSSLVVVGGDQKVVLNEGDYIEVYSDTASSADVAMSILEIS
jgi:hypothetical protein